MKTSIVTRTSNCSYFPRACPVQRNVVFWVVSGHGHIFWRRPAGQSRQPLPASSPGTYLPQLQSTLGLQCLQAPSHSGFSSPDSILPPLPPAGFFPSLAPLALPGHVGLFVPPLCPRSLSSFLTVRRSKVPPSHRVSLSASFLLNDTHITSLSGLLLKSSSLPRFATRAAVSSCIAPLTSSGPSCFPGQTPKWAG